MLELRINEKVIRKLRVNGFYPDTMISGLMTLVALKQGLTPLLNAIDDSSYSKRSILIYYDLLRKGVIEECKEGCEDLPSIYMLTERGNRLLEDIELLYPKEEVVDMAKEVIDNVEEWIEEWVNMFPKGVRSGSKLVKSDKKSCLIKMKTFIKNYPEYDKDLIMAATKKYIEDNEVKDDNTTYMLAAIYFINHKEKGSELASVCENYKEQDNVHISESFIFNNGLI